MPVDSTESQNKIMDHIIQSLPADRYYIDHEEGSNTFKIRENSLQKEKNDFFQLIFNTNKNLRRSKNKTKQTELKKLSHPNVGGLV